MKRVTAALAISALIVLAPLPAVGHTDKQLKAWKKDWKARYALVNVEAVAALDGELLSMLQHLDAERTDMESRHKCQLLKKNCPSPVRRGITPHRNYSPGVEQWRELVKSIFPAAQVNKAMAVMKCESNGNPNADNPRSSALGLWQFLKDTWNRTADRIGAPPYPAGARDPEWSTRGAYDLWKRFGWSPWSCA
jgi:hypothetical protein